MRICFTKVLCLAAALVISLAGNSQAASFASTLRANFTFTTVKDNPLGFPGNMTLQVTLESYSKQTKMAS